MAMNNLVSRDLNDWSPFLVLILDKLDLCCLFIAVSAAKIAAAAAVAMKKEQRLPCPEGQRRLHFKLI